MLITGCVGSDTVQYTGMDVFFLSQTGLKSFGRTIQEKSMPLNSLSGTITKDIITLLKTESESFKSVYYPEENFYLLTFTGQDVTLCFDIRGALENGAYRATRWPLTTFTSYVRQDSGALLVGSALGIGQYTGYQDNGLSYRFKYSSPELTFGDPSILKFLKKLRPTIIGGSGQPVSMRWAYDFGSRSDSIIISVGASDPSEFNIAEFNIAEFTSGKLVIRDSVNVGGSGTTLAVTIEADINGTELSLQEINVLALMGKII